MLTNLGVETFSPENTVLMMYVAKSELGQQLARQVRYGRYYPKLQGVDQFDLPVDEQTAVVREWTEEILDVDANNLYHHTITALFGQWACKRDEVDADTTNRVVRDLLVHDVAEARFTRSDEGDLTYDEAHAQGAEGFYGEHRDLAERLRLFPMFTDEDAAQVEADMNDAKKDQPETLAGQYIEIAERIGYIHAGTTAIRHAMTKLASANHEGDINPDYMNLLWMGENCYGNSLNRLITLSLSREPEPRYKSVEDFLVLRRHIITKALGLIVGRKEDIWDCYRADGKDETLVAERDRKVREAFAAWYGSRLNCTTPLRPLSLQN